VKEGFVDFPQDEPETIRQMIEFLYTNDYTCKTATLAATSEPEPEPTFYKSKKKKKSVIAAKEQHNAWSYPEFIRIMEGHVKVYQIADKYGIPNLLAKAFDNIDKASFEGSAAENLFAAFVELVLCCTSRSDIQLRPWITRCCIEAHRNLVLNAKVERVMKEHEPVAWIVGTSSNLNEAVCWCDDCGSYVACPRCAS
jgi:hypothetical protein